MDTRSLRPESHVAQQSRRDKLRIQQSNLTSIHHLDQDGFPNNLEQLSSTVHSAINPDLLQVRNIRNGSMIYDPTVFSSEMLNFASSSNVLSASHERDGMINDHGQELVGTVHTSRPEDSSSLMTNVSHPILSSFNASPKSRTGHDPQGYGNWRSPDSPHCYDWMVNYASGSAGGERNHKPVFVGEGLSNHARVSNITSPTSIQYTKPSYNGYQDVHQIQPNLANLSNDISSQYSPKHFREIQFSSHPLYYNTLQDVVTSASVGGNEGILPQSFENQSAALHFDNANAWMSRPVENCHHWSGNVLGHTARKNEQELRTIANDANTQGLSLSLSSNANQFGDGCKSESTPVKIGGFKEPHQDSKIAKSNHTPKPSITSKGFGKSLQDIVGSTHVLRNTGPLGPFTGYAIILKSSRFLKPAQELLDEFCCVTGSKTMRTERIAGEVGSSASDSADAEGGVLNSNNNSGVSSSTFYSSKEGSTSESVGPEFQQKKAKLLYLQEEVCRRYKQYHQQMQMVASSFESVAGLSSATPYISLALKTVSRNFRSLRHAISDQLKLATKSLGEDLYSTHTVASGSRGDTIISRLRYMDQGFQRQKSGGANVGFLEPQQHIWRPQRGLPERSVAILRAWLFEHFLHPYPTDTDKHMLATQTGLSRNQVSNWFINARVRVWKPMVEEIHMLETKGLSEGNQGSGKNDGNSAEGTSQPNDDQLFNKLGTNSVINKPLECSNLGSTVGIGELDAESWDHEKRSRVEFQDPTSMDGSLMNFLPFQSSGMDNAGLGAVSLTLGLRHGVENAQQQQQHPSQLQQNEDQVRRQFGGHMIHDFVG